MSVTLHAAALLLICAVAAHCAPTFQEDRDENSPVASPPTAEWEEARQIWSGVKMLKKQLPSRVAKRSENSANPTPATSNDYGLSNVSAPAYMKELYRNLSRHNSSEIDATTIRSLPALHSEEGHYGCGFNFSIGSVSPHEILRRADLRIHMKQPSGDEVNSVYLQLYHGSRPGNFKIVSPIREGWVVFDVLNEVNQWKSADHPNKKIHFYVVVFNSLEDLAKKENGKDCDESSIQFNQITESSSADIADYQPLLMIYSHDMNAVKFNVSALVNSSLIERSRRQTPTVESLSDSCRKESLQINITTFNTIWHLGERSQTALYPREFNINVCGGRCNKNVPDSSKQHSIVLYYLATRNHATRYSNAVWDQCCAPVKYSNIEALFSLPGGEFRIEQLRDMSVEQCTCLNILRPSSTPSSR